MKRFWGVFAMLAACNNGGLEAGSSPMNPAPVVVQSDQVCLSDGSFDFHVFGDGYAAYEGRLVGAAAIEGPRRPVQMMTTVAGGAFSIACPSSLRENYDYPSYALFFDVDGNGKCGVGDVGVEMQLFGWNRAVEDHLGVTNDWARMQPVTAQNPATGGELRASFCQDYFP